MRQKRQVYNPFLPLNEYIPDGEPHVFEGRIYLFGSHDRFNGDRYCMDDYVCYSADIHDITDWKMEGVIYRKDQDPRNMTGSHCLWAPDVAKGPDGKYYLYYCFDTLPEIGVAVSSQPYGPYDYLGLVHDSNGTVLGRGAGDLIQFDPGIFIDHDDEIYLYSGNAPRHQNEEMNKGSQVMRLYPDMITLKDKPRPLIPDVRNSRGTGFEGHEFFEASSIRRIGEIYYFIYSDIQSSALCYAVSDKPDKNYRFGGQIITLGDTGYQGRRADQPQNFTGNIHGGMECINGRWYIFYHRQTNKTQFSRQACAEEITILPDGSIPQVEMTSCGLNGGPLSGEGRYPAVIACNLQGKEGAVFSSKLLMDKRFPFFTQEDSCPFIANMTDGALAGYKYFDIKNAETIIVEIRGSASGKMVVYSGSEEVICAEIKIDAETEEWIAFSASFHVKASATALSFIYKGKGAIDFKSFELKGRKTCE